jgi:hypothetical protein
VVAEVGVHDDDEVARRELQAMDVCGAEAELAGAGLQLDAIAAAGGVVGFLQSAGDGLGAVGAAVVDDDDFPVEVVRVEGLSEEVGDDGEL